jgi:hypothetical protein
VSGDDWQAGDLALCVRDGIIHCQNRIRHLGTRVRRGQVREVLSVRVPPPCKDGHPCDCGCRALFFANEVSGVTARFVKVTPREADEWDRETIALLTGKPAKVEA